MAKVNMKSTKAEIFEKLQEVEKQLEAERNSKKTAVDVAQEKVATERKVKVNNLVGKEILSQEIIDGYNALKEEEVSIKKRIKDLYDIEVNLNTLDALKIVHKEELEKHKAELESINEEIKTSKLETQREREEEEKEYIFQRDKKRKAEQREYETKKTEREITLQEKERLVECRERDIANREEEITNLYKEITELKLLAEEKYKEGLEKGKKDESKSNVFEKRALENKHSAEIEKMQNKIEILEDSLSTEKQRNIDLSSKLDKAYEKINNTALEVAKNSGTKILNDNK